MLKTAPEFTSYSGFLSPPFFSGKFKNFGSVITFEATATSVPLQTIYYFYASFVRIGKGNGFRKGNNLYLCSPPCRSPLINETCNSF